MARCLAIPNFQPMFFSEQKAYLDQLNLPALPPEVLEEVHQMEEQSEIDISTSLHDVLLDYLREKKLKPSSPL